MIDGRWRAYTRKKISLVGLAICGGIAASLSVDSDMIAALGELIVALLASAPGLSTATSLMVDAGLMYRDATWSGPGEVDDGHPEGGQGQGD